MCEYVAGLFFLHREQDLVKGDKEVGGEKNKKKKKKKRLREKSKTRTHSFACGEETRKMKERKKGRRKKDGEAESKKERTPLRKTRHRRMMQDLFVVSLFPLSSFSFSFLSLLSSLHRLLHRLLCLFQPWEEGL